MGFRLDGFCRPDRKHWTKDVAKFHFGKAFNQICPHFRRDRTESGRPRRIVVVVMANFLRQPATLQILDSHILSAGSQHPWYLGCSKSGLSGHNQ
jgi:hypothetical protein